MRWYMIVMSISIQVFCIFELSFNLCRVGEVEIGLYFVVQL